MGLRDELQILGDSVKQTAEDWDEGRQKWIDTSSQKVDDVVTGGLERLNVPGAEFIGDRSRNVTGFAQDVLLPESWELPIIAGAAAMPADGPLGEAAIYGTGVINRSRRLAKAAKKATLANMANIVDDAFSKANSLFSRATNPNWRLATPNNIDVNPNVMQSKGVGPGTPKKTFSISTSKYAKNFNEQDLIDYENAALQHRLSRSESKRNLMKGFEYKNSGTPYIYDKNQEAYLLTRRRGASKLNLDPTDSSNFQLVPVADHINRLARRTKWTKGAKELEQLKKALNQMGPNPRFYEPLMQHGDNAYLEHKVGKGADWFWNLRKKDPNFASWLDPNITRNSEGNIRILFNDSFERLKNTVEGKVKATNKLIKNNRNKYIIDLEDPISGDFAKRSNPGNIAVRKADTGEVIGVIPDYLQELYTENFTKNFNYKDLIDRPGNPVPEFYRAKPGETAEKYVSRILKERLDLIFNKQVDTSARDIGEHVIDDTADFYELFSRSLEWVRKPEYIEQLMNQ
jgi:hypothetical protein